MKLRELFLKEDTGDDTGFDSGTHPGHKHNGKRDAINPDHEAAIPGLVTIPDWPGQYYNMYRLGVHMAGSPHNPSEHEGVANNEMVITQYTDVDTEIINHSAKALGVKVKALTKKGSVEPKGINVASPVAKPKRNKYGI
jgi:hypothetical protein